MRNRNPLRLIAAGAAASLIAVVAPPAVAALTLNLKFSDHLIVPGQSIAGIALGEPIAQALATLGNPPAAAGCATATSCKLGTFGSGTFVISIDQNQPNDPVVDGVEITTPQGGKPHYTGPLITLHSAQGVHLGSTRGVVHRAFPGDQTEGINVIIHDPQDPHTQTVLTVGTGSHGRVLSIGISGLPSTT